METRRRNYSSKMKRKLENETRMIQHCKIPANGNVLWQVSFTSRSYYVYGLILRNVTINQEAKTQPNNNTE